MMKRNVISYNSNETEFNTMEVTNSHRHWPQRVASTILQSVRCDPLGPRWRSGHNNLINNDSDMIIRRH